MKDLYSLSKLDYAEKDTKAHYEKVLGKLSIFAPLSHEVPEVPKQDELLLDRPITPIDDEVKAPPPTFQHLTKLVRRRISAKDEIKHITVDDQKELAAVIMGEVNGIWKDLSLQVDDPLLSGENNVELQRRITVYIVTACEQLFQIAIRKAQILNKRGVFSTPANMSRLKAQLSIDASTFLNVLTIRRYIIEDLKRKSRNLDSSRSTPMDVTLPLTKPNFKTFLELSRPRVKLELEETPSEKDINKQFAELLPTIDSSFLQTVLEDLPKAKSRKELSVSQDFLNWLMRKRGQTEEPESSETSLFDPFPIGDDTTDDDDDIISNSSEDDSFNSRNREVRNRIFLESERTKSEIMTQKNVLLKLSKSMPRFDIGENLLEELGIDSIPKKLCKSALGLHDLSELPTNPGGDTSQQILPLMGDNAVAKDLRKLTRHTSNLDNHAQDPDEVPALIQALTTSVNHDKKKLLIQQQLKMLEESEVKQRQSETLLLHQPKYPQPAVVTNKIGKGLVVRTSDVRVSERVCLSSVTLKKHGTIYNDLLDEVDPAMLKKLDNNLFLHSEINEVYEEIMKTVPFDHLDLSNDPLIRPTAININLAEALASKTLSLRRKDRVINPALHKIVDAPWGEQAQRDWVKTPTDPPLDFRGNPTIQQIAPNSKLDEWTDIVGADANDVKKAMLGIDTNPEAQPGQGGKDEDQPGLSALENFTARNYASWLAWWKDNITSEDYQKYLSTQGSDYLGVVFHYYNSDSDEESEHEEDEEGKHPSPKGRVRGNRSRLTDKQQENEKEEELEALRKMKNIYTRGMWNVLTVAMGGLGKDPIEADAQILKEVDPLNELEKKLNIFQFEANRNSQNNKAELSSPERNMASHNKNLTQEPSSQKKQSSRDTTSLKKEADRPPTKDTSPQKRPVPIQERFENVWAALEVPDYECLEMAIKYCDESNFRRISQAVEYWEEATELIIKREELMSQLSTFETKASDPNRFFEKGPNGSSNARLKESRIRGRLHKKIDLLTPHILEVVTYIKKHFNDTITYKGTPYTEKMKVDRTELLHWLQEQRRIQAIHYETRVRSLKPLPAYQVDVHRSQCKLPPAMDKPKPPERKTLFL